MLDIFIASSSPIIVKGLEELLNVKYNIIGFKFNGQSALNFIIKNKPSLAILDVQMPKVTGLEIAEKCKKLNINTKIIFLTQRKEIEPYLESKKQNIYGYLFTDFSLSEIEKCIDLVFKGTAFFSSKIEKKLIYCDNPTHPLKKMTPAELRILLYMGDNKTSKEIADLLFLSKKTIDNQKGSIIRKLDLTTKNRSLNDWVEKNKHVFHKIPQ